MSLFYIQGFFKGFFVFFCFWIFFNVWIGCRHMRALFLCSSPIALGVIYSIIPLTSFRTYIHYLIYISLWVLNLIRRFALAFLFFQYFSRATIRSYFLWWDLWLSDCRSLNWIQFPNWKNNFDFTVHKDFFLYVFDGLQFFSDMEEIL